MPKATSIYDVQSNIRALPSMSMLLPDDYAEKDGWADIVADKTKINSTQLRKVFQAIKDLKREFKKNDFNRAKVALLMPSLAYANGRGHLPEELYNLLCLCFGQDKCKTLADFNSAADFLEAILAYYKYHHPQKQEG